MNSQPAPVDAAIAELRRAIASNDQSAIRAALPDPPKFLNAVFKLPREERDAVLGGVLPALEADEDIWEVVEAAAINDMARPDSCALHAVAPYLLPDYIADALDLARKIPDTGRSAEAQQAIQARAVELDLAFDR